MAKYAASVEATKTQDARYTVEANTDTEAYEKICCLARDEFPDADTVEVGDVYEDDGETGEVSNLDDDLYYEDSTEAEQPDVIFPVDEDTFH